ncbi:MAG TPA: hypothetical protein VG323_06785 [Thermoanaerobaculia bacterium]|nr:hypothetical protein [Thermoanaerobaculia bacterium]
MKRVVVAITILLVCACSTGTPGATQTSSVPGHGAISLSVAPNPIVAQKVSGNTYDFPFDVIVRETGGRAVTINRVTADIYASVGGIKIGSESYDAAKIRSLGYSTSVPANGEIRDHFAPRKSVQDERLFGGVYGDVRVDATDDSGTATSATVRVTVTQ